MLFINADDNLLLNEAKNIKSYTYSNNNLAKINVKLIDSKPFIHVDFENTEIKSNLLGMNE